MNAKVLGIFLLLVALCVFMSISVPESFLRGNNIENVLRRTAMYGILGIGVAFVIITGGIDLSIGSIVCLSGCLLALFLHVDYEPFEGQRVLAVQASQRTIVIPGQQELFEVGDRVRYYGGRRAKNALVTVTRVTATDFETDEGGSIAATAVEVDQPLSADDRYGRVAKILDVVAFDGGGADPAESPPSVTIAGRHDRMQGRDQLALVHPQLGLKQLEVLTAEAEDGQTIVTLGDDLGQDFSRQWLATPIERRQRMPALVGVALVLGIALCLGLLHGLLITKLDLPPFVVTLCGLLFYRGISRWLVNDQVQGFGDEYNESLRILAQGKLMLPWGEEGLGLPFPFFIMVITAVLAAVFLNKTIWGRYMQALGRNVEAARYSGINTGRVTVLAYMICTVCAALGGMLFALDSNSVSPSSFGNFFELYAIAAAVLGGCSLRGGEGGILGVVIGTAVMQTLNNLIVLLHIPQQLEFAIVGLVILAGVVADVLFRRLVARRRAIAQARQRD